MRTLYIAQNLHQAQYNFNRKRDVLVVGGYSVNCTTLTARKSSDDWMVWDYDGNDFICKNRGMRIDRVVLLSGAKVTLSVIGPMMSAPGCQAIIEAE